MHLQGNLQAVFDALFTIGVIDPVLRMDWHEALKERHRFEADVTRALAIANRFSGDQNLLLNELKRFDENTLKFLAMEVAREYADYHARKELH